MAVRSLDGPVLMGDAGVVAGRGHAVMGAQRVVATGEVGGGVRVEVAEGGREAVCAMLAGRTAQAPEGILHPLGERYEALAAQHHVGMLEARVGEPEVVEPVIERDPGDGDAGGIHVGEVRQADSPGLMGLAEDDLLLRTVQRPPGPDAALQGAPDAGIELGVTPNHLLEQGDRTKAGGRLQQRHDLVLEDRGQGIGSPPAPRGLLQGRQAWILLDAVGGGGTEASLGGRGTPRVGLTELHVEPHLAIGHMAARHARTLLGEEGRPHSRPAVIARSRSRPCGRAPPFLRDANEISAPS